MAKRWVKKVCARSPCGRRWTLSGSWPTPLRIVWLQINGKLRSHFQMSPGTSKDVLEKEALKDPKVQALITGKSPS